MSQILFLQPLTEREETSTLSSSHTLRKSAPNPSLESECFETSESYAAVDSNNAKTSFLKTEISKYPEQKTHVSPPINTISHGTISLLRSSHSPKVLQVEQNRLSSPSCLKKSSNLQPADGNFSNTEPATSKTVLNSLKNAALVNPINNTKSYKAVSILRSSYNQNMMTSSKKNSGSATHSMQLKKECNDHESSDRSLTSLNCDTSKTVILNNSQFTEFPNPSIDTNCQKAVSVFEPFHSTKLPTDQLKYTKLTTNFETTEYNNCLKSTDKIISIVQPPILNNVILSHPNQNITVSSPNFSSPFVTSINDLSHNPSISPDQPLLYSLSINLTNLQPVLIPESSPNPNIMPNQQSLYATDVNLINIQPSLSQNLILNHSFVSPLIYVDGITPKIVAADKNTEQQILSTNVKNTSEDNLELSLKSSSGIQVVAPKTVTFNPSELTANNLESPGCFKTSKCYEVTDFMNKNSNTMKTISSTNKIANHSEQTVFANHSSNFTNVKSVFDSSHKQKISTKRVNLFDPSILFKASGYIKSRCKNTEQTLSTNVKNTSEDNLELSLKNSSGFQVVAPKTVTFNPSELTANNLESPRCFKTSKCYEVTDFMDKNSNTMKTISSTNKIPNHSEQIVFANHSSNFTNVKSVVNSSHKSKISTNRTNLFDPSTLFKASSDIKSTKLSISNIQSTTSNFAALNHPKSSTFVNPSINLKRPKTVSILRSSHNSNMLKTKQDFFKPPINLAHIKIEPEDHLLLPEEKLSNSTMTSPRTAINTNTNGHKTASSSSDNSKINMSELMSYSTNTGYNNINPVSSETVILNHQASNTLADSLKNINCHKTVSILNSSNDSKVVTGEQDLFEPATHSIFIKKEYADHQEPPKNALSVVHPIASKDVIFNQPEHSEYIDPPISNNCHEIVIKSEDTMSNDVQEFFTSISNGTIDQTSFDCISSTEINVGNQGVPKTKNISTGEELEKSILNSISNTQILHFPDAMNSQANVSNSEDIVYLLPLEIANLLQDSSLVTNINHTLSDTDISNLILSAASLSSSSAVQSSIVQPNDAAITQGTDDLKQSGKKEPTLRDLIEPLEKYFRGNKCLLCGFQSKARWNHRARQHLITHLQNRDFKCDICGQTFTTPTSLSLHQASHSSEYPFACGECGGRFQHKQKLSTHLRKHRRFITYSCPICNIEYKTTRSLKQHLRDHTGEEPYMCSVCKATFKTRQMLRNHSFQHNTEKLYKCPSCDKGYNNKSLLADHMRCHKKMPAHKCKICEKKFNFRSNLAQHMLVHNDARKHTCEVCNMKFKLPHHLRAHAVACRGEE